MSFEQLYRAQCTEHEKTHARLRIVEKENANLRSLLSVQGRELADSIEMLRGIATNIQKAYPKPKRTIR